MLILVIGVNDWVLEVWAFGHSETAKNAERHLRLGSLFHSRGAHSQWESAHKRGAAVLQLALYCLLGMFPV